MNAPMPQTAFRGPRDNIFGGAIDHARLADRLPLRVICQCRAHWDDPALDHIHFEREVDLGTFVDLATAMASSATSLTPGRLLADCDPDLRLLPQFVTILDAEGGLVLASAVQTGVVRWCAPVDGDAEARRVVNEACRLRAQARTALETERPLVADAQLACARALEGRLVDPFWRDHAMSILGNADVA